MRSLTRLLDQLLPALLIAAAVTLLAAGLFAYIAPGTFRAPELAADPSVAPSLVVATPSVVPATPEPSIARPTPLSEVLRDAPEASRADLYALAFTVVRADEGVSGSERVYLAHLASRLALTPDRTAALEARTAAAIDAAPAS